MHGFSAEIIKRFIFSVYCCRVGYIYPLTDKASVNPSHSDTPFLLFRHGNADGGIVSHTQVNGKHSRLTATGYGGYGQGGERDGKNPLSA